MLTFNDHAEAPQLGFGVFQIDNDKASAAVATALEVGYRSIDTAAFYKNEEGVGDGIRRSGIPRGDLFLTTKLWNGDQGFDAALKAFDASMKKLGTDYLDLYLIHWPLPKKDRYVESWKAFIQLQNEGRIKSIGVSNFQPDHLQRLIKETGVVPVVNQIELHPDFTQRDVVAFNSQHHIVTEAWSPLGQGGELLKQKTLVDLGTRYGKSAAQVTLRWHIQRGHMVIPKSEHAERIRENFAIFDFDLGEDELQMIDALDAGNRLGPDPDELN
ncbi:MAG: aldo/keto reductase [Pseudomonadota bacterium]|nr:aldo/keto reductase [Pseudomonadota bacterium]